MIRVKVVPYDLIYLKVFQKYIQFIYVLLSRRRVGTECIFFIYSSNFISLTIIYVIQNAHVKHCMHKN